VVQHLPKVSIHPFLCSSNFGNLKCLFFIADLVYKAFMFNFSHIQIPGDQEGLFKLAVQLRKFFNSVIYNTATGYVLLVYFTNI
jgi:hypothetical protein